MPRQSQGFDNPASLPRHLICRVISARRVPIQDELQSCSLDFMRNRASRYVGLGFVFRHVESCPINTDRIAVGEFKVDYIWPERYPKLAIVKC